MKKLAIIALFSPLFGISQTDPPDKGYITDSVVYDKIGSHFFTFEDEQVNQHGFWIKRDNYGAKSYEIYLFFRGYPVYDKYIRNGKTEYYHRYLKTIKHFNLLF